VAAAGVGSKSTGSGKSHAAMHGFFVCHKLNDAHAESLPQFAAFSRILSR
jgi:hypothetical protein